MSAAGQTLRRRIILAVILLAAFIILLRVAVLAGEFDTVITAATFEAARENRTALRAFLHRMPKGGDLHTHLAGAVYAERFIAWAAQQELCVSPQRVVVPKPQCDRAGAVPVSDAMRDQQLYNWLVDAFSMRAFLPTPAVPTGHDEFFAAFDKFGAVSGSHFVDMTIDQLRRYDSENVQYVEFMVSSWCPDDRDRFVKAINETTDDASKLKTLEASGLGDCVAARRNVLTAALGKIRTALACDAPKAQPGCGVTFRYIIQVNRNNPPDEVFVQTAIAAALIRAEPRVVEVNLTSTDLILGVRGKDHPLPTYLAAGVPVVLSSDDAGISRIDLTNEYLRAARDFGLEYRALKAIARNALIYSFLDEAQKRDELARFDRASAEFERSVASRQSPLQNVVALIKAAVTLPP